MSAQPDGTVVPVTGIALVTGPPCYRRRGPRRPVSPLAGSRRMIVISCPGRAMPGRDSGYFVAYLAMNCGRDSLKPSTQYGPLYLGLEAYLAKNAGLFWSG
jgi:hypothetical protein